MISESKISKLIKDLLSAQGFLVLKGFRFPPCEFDILAVHPVSLSIVSVEIKKNNWKDVLNQALRAKLFCHYSYVALPTSFEKNICLDDFVSRNVGLLFYEGTKKSNFKFSVKHHSDLNTEINRFFKKKIYEEIGHKFERQVYA